MAQTLMEKVRALSLGTLHSLLNRQIDRNIIPVCEQYVRDLEANKSKIRDMAAEARGVAATSQARVATLQHQIETDTEHAQLLMNDDDPSNDGEVQPIMENVVRLQDQLEDQKTQASSDQQAAEALGQMVRTVTSKLADEQNNLARLRRLDRNATAKEQTADTLQAATQLMGASGDMSVDNAAHRLEQREAVADEKLKDAMADASGGSAQMSVTAARAKQLIEQMRAAKGGAASSATSA